MSESLVAIQPAVQQFLDRHHGLWIEGRQAASDSEKRLNVYNPATGEVIASTADASVDDVDRAVMSGWRAFVARSWAGKLPAERERILLHFADLVEQHSEELAQLETLEQGKSINISRAFEVGCTLNWMRYTAGLTTKIAGKTLDLSIPLPQGARYQAWTRKEPVGVVAGIVPWNFPLMIGMWKVMPALAAGCSIVIKPSETTPLTMLRVAELAKAVGIPDGVINVVNGAGGEIAQRLITHPACAKVSFTGSVATGEKVQQSAGAFGKRVTLELGGKNAALFLDDLTPEAMVNGIIEAGYLNQGQICAAAERFYLPQGKLDAVLALLKDKLSAFAPGSPLDERTLMGPLANRQQYDKVLRLIQTARDEGDTIVCGGEALPGEGYFLQPTAVKVRSEESTLMREETFGPVCSFIGYRSEEEALARMNASPYGLAASVWSDNIRQALRYSEAIEAGIVWVNMHTFLDPAVPFGGMKGSGIGREFGSAFIDDYTELKSVMVRY